MTMIPWDASDYDWREAFAVAQPPTRVPGAAVSVDSFTTEDVVSAFAVVEGENDGPSWIGVFELRDGRWAVVNSWCDYTGWDCQAGGESRVAPTLEMLWEMGLSDEERSRVGPCADSPARVGPRGS
jgi:hypothetical protein